MAGLQSYLTPPAGISYPEISLFINRLMFGGGKSDRRDRLVTSGLPPTEKQLVFGEP